MSDKEQKVSESMLKFENNSVVGIKDAYEEAMNMVATLVGVGGLSQDQGFMVLDSIRELLHWMYVKPGEHSTPTELIVRSVNLLMEQQGNQSVGGEKLDTAWDGPVSSDAAPTAVPTFNIKKTND